MCEYTKESQIKGGRQLNELTESIAVISNKFDKYEREKKEKDEIIQNMKKDMTKMSEKILKP